MPARLASILGKLWTELVEVHHDKEEINYVFHINPIQLEFCNSQDQSLTAAGLNYHTFLVWKSEKLSDSTASFHKEHWCEAMLGVGNACSQVMLIGHDLKSLR